MEEFANAGTQVVFVQCPLEDTPEGRVLFNIKGVFAEYEREKIRERTLRGKVRYIREGGWFGLPPFGYKVVGQRLEIDTSEAPWLREIFGRYARGEATLQQLARYLTEMAVPTRRATKDQKWNPSVIGRMLTRELYAGVFRREIKGVPESSCEIAVPPIVDHDIWEAAQRRFSANRAEAQKNKTHFYPLTGLLRCGVCGGRYHGRFMAASGYRYYRCTTNQNPTRYTIRCGNRGVRADKLEAAIWDQVVTFVTRPEAVLMGQRLLAGEATVDGRAELDEQLFHLGRMEAKVSVRKSRLLDLMLDRPQDKAMLSEKLDALDLELGRIAYRRGRLVEAIDQASSLAERLEQINDLFRTLSSRIQSLTADERRGVCHLLIESIRISKDGPTQIDWLIPLPPAGAPTVDPQANGPAVTHKSPRSQRR
jgi:site-specific DNA recombinase